ncbi:hypothetical protein GCM10023340_15270 [Nocardioides marinquilinus]|uniref:NAD-dependent epimerase/dehydratase domain-containing protein n=1 Tax=Nocardioides marinquilinus TaxID=1210400 RepID=A0ABP9PF36_9ACTN
MTDTPSAEPLDPDEVTDWTDHDRPVVVTGANGFVGAAVCVALLERGVPVRGVVRRPGTAPQGVEEVVGDFADPATAERLVDGADAVVTTVYPMADGVDLATQRAVSVDGTTTLARAAARAGLERLVHVSTAAVYDRSPGAGDCPESGRLVADDAGDYAVTKRDTDAALAAGDLDGLTRVLVRPPAILGAGETSMWNTARPAEIAEDDALRHASPETTFAWVHVRDLAALVAQLATGRVPFADDPEHGPVAGACTAVNVAGEPATQRDYVGTVCEALGVEPTWDAETGWTGRIVTDRATRWGWTPRVTLAEALRELGDGLRR